ncbi:MAG: uroporphyrinogen-III synthase [Flavobacterium sp.]
MQNQIRILATKKLYDKQKQQLLNADFLVFDEDFISIQNKEFEIGTVNDYLIFTSQNAVESVLLHKKTAEIKAVKCFCVGEKTKALLEQNGFEVMQYSDYAAELASVICNQYYKNSFTFFCGNIRRDVLPDALRLMKIKLDEIEVYETVLVPKKITSEPDGILFFSPSAVVSYLKENKIDKQNCFCIGTTTAEALKNKTKSIIIANQPTIEGVIMKCIENYKN